MSMSMSMSILTVPISLPAKFPWTSPEYPERSLVPDYNPVEFTSAKVYNPETGFCAVWADKPVVDVEAILKRQCYSTGSVVPFKNTKYGLRPFNPVGPTGLTGRGLLGKWGPNYAADPIVTRLVNGILQIVLIERDDSPGTWALPGGMVEEGQTIKETLKKEFGEEAMCTLSLEPGLGLKYVQDQLDTIFNKNGREIFRGYVRDPRNTDNAWMETVAVHFHIEDTKFAEALKLKAGDDAMKVMWVPVDDDIPIFKNLYASHHDFVRKAVESREDLKNAANFHKL